MVPCMHYVLANPCPGDAAEAAQLLRSTVLHASASQGAADLLAKGALRQLLRVTHNLHLHLFKGASHQRPWLSQLLAGSGGTGLSIKVWSR